MSVRGVSRFAWRVSQTPPVALVLSCSRVSTPPRVYARWLRATKFTTPVGPARFLPTAAVSIATMVTQALRYDLRRSDPASLAMALSQHLQQREFDSMHECPRSSYVRECSASASANRRRPVDRRRLAVLVSGHTRTMGTMDVVATYQQMFLMAAQEFAGGVHVFAYLDGGRTPTTAALKMFAAVPTTVLWHDESTLWGLLNGLQNGSTCDRRVCARTSTLPSLIQQRLNHPYTDQYAKVAATTEMMRRAERLTGMKFDVVLRVRPDLCLGAAMKTFGTVFAHMHHCSPMLLVWNDGLAIYPRWAGEPFTTIWLRGAGLCDFANDNSHDKHSAPRSPLWSLGGGEISLFESWFAPLGIRGAEMIDYWCQGFRNFSCAERVSLRREARMTGPYAQVGVAKVLGVRVDACAVWY